MRVSIEQVKGVWQGAAYAFREGFQSGILRRAHGEDDSLLVGESNRVTFRRPCTSGRRQLP